MQLADYQIKEKGRGGLLVRKVAYGHIELTNRMSFLRNQPKGKSSPWQSDLWKDRSLDHMKCSSVEF